MLSATPGTKASKAAQNCSRMVSRSCRISWREPLQHDLRAGAQADGELLDRLALHHLIVACRQHQHRHADARREFFSADPLDRIQRGLQPADGRRLDSDLGRRLEHREVAQIALPVRRQSIALERLVVTIFGRVARHRTLAETEHRQPVGELAAQTRCDIGSPAILTIGAVKTMRVNQQPRLIAALNSTMAAIEWPSAK